MSQFDFTERLFSLDSDDSSYVMQADHFNQLQTQERDYYENLFTPDSDYQHENLDDTSISTAAVNSPKIFKFDNMPQELFKVPTTNGTHDRVKHMTQEEFSETSSLSSVTSGSTESLSCLESIPNTFHPIDDELPPLSTFMNDDDIRTLLEGEHHLPPHDIHEKQVELNEDIIACFNVQNQYDHLMATSLFLKEKLSFLAIQEPFSSQHKVSESWRAFRLMEMQSARIQCFETPYQVVMYDSWKWGGKILYPFKSEQYGRVTSIAFQLDSKKIGFISVYAATNVFRPKSAETEHSSIEITSNIIRKIMKKWKSENSDIAIVVLGDFQETVSTTDRDNIGNYRQISSPSGVLNLLGHSFESIARKLGGAKEYVTRFGREGARGIDHIMVPTACHLQSSIIDAGPQRSTGAKYFPSDHSLLTCTFRRSGQNNNESGTTKPRYDFRKIYSIKLQQSGPNGEEFALDDKQFKESKNFQQQFKLYRELQNLSGNKAAFTSTYLDDTEMRIRQLYLSLWTTGLRQKVDGNNNKLVNITENQALNLAIILQTFDSGVKAIMEKMKLRDDSHPNDKAGFIRGSIRKNKGMKLFENLPIQTKLRYLKTSVMTKYRIIQQKLLWLSEYQLRLKFNCSLPDVNTFWNSFQPLLNSSEFVKHSGIIGKALQTEILERQRHIEAIAYKKAEKRTNNQSVRKAKKTLHRNKATRKPNTLHHVDKKLTMKINFWLKESHCNQPFNSETDCNIYDNLTGPTFSKWNEHILNIDADIWDFSIESSRDRLTLKLDKTKTNLKNIYHCITRIQTRYRRETLSHLLETNNIDTFTRKVLPKGRSAPAAAHSVIWDPRLNDFRNCIDEIEEMEATSAYHGKWMGNTSAPEVCAYAKLVTKGKLGVRGVKLHPNRIVTKADLATLLPPDCKLPAKIKTSFLKAHNIHTAKLFQEPKKEHPELFFPFFLTSSDGCMKDESEFTTKFWKCLARIPSKARYDGFQMSVIGRFGPRWRKTLLNIIKLILIMRFVPPSLRRMARFPIPKPGKRNEYRPISLCNDIYCYINAVVTSYTSLGIEKAKILYDGMCAYRKGKGCSSLVTMELSFREDCNEHNLPVLQLDEDEEKFFDRIPVEVLLAAMRINGFPNQGFLELKACSMQSKTVEIITSKGIAYSKFVCGLEQGNPDSPTISNLVIKLKHDIWSVLTDEAKQLLSKDTDLTNITSTKPSYTFQTPDRHGKIVSINQIGYCDDNTKFCCVKNEKDLIWLASYFLQLSGNLSMVTKIGRKSSKCELHFFNISAETAVTLKQCWSTAWSFLDDGPIEESVPFKLHLKAVELKKLYTLIDYFELDEEKQTYWDKIIHPHAHKHLGLKCTLGGNTSASCQETLYKIQDRVSTLKLHNMHKDAQIKCVNMLCSTMHSFVPLQTQFSCKDLGKIDKVISNSLLKRHGLTSTDSLHRLYLPTHLGGQGFISLLDQDIVSVARELEIISNLSSLDGDAFRTRLQANCTYVLHTDDTIINHARFAIQKLARFGIFLQHRDDDIINNVLSELCISGTYASIGCLPFRNGNNCSFGEGKHRNSALAYGNNIWRVLRAWRYNGMVWNKEVTTLAQDLRINTKNIIEITDKIQTKRFYSSASIFSYWEWTNTNFDKLHVSDSICDWKFIDIPQQIIHLYPDRYLTLTDIEIQKIAKTILMIRGWNTNTPHNPYSFTNNLSQYILRSQSPLFVSTDGAHEIKSDNNNITTSAFVLSVADIRNNETITSGEWIHRPTKPLLGRATILPKRIGTVRSDIATGEMWAYAFSEMSLPQHLPRVVITDSKSTRDILQALRTKTSKKDIDREYIRSIAGGISKFIINIFQNNLWNFDEHNNTTLNFLFQTLKLRLKIICDLGQEWIQNSPMNTQNKDNDDQRWNKSYFECHPFRTIWKIDSHQLNKEGTAIKNPSRYSSLIPNFSILTTNHHADTCADVVKGFTQTIFDINIVYSSLDYSLVWGGMTVDRHISTVLWNAFAEERMKRLQRKATQGLLWRWKPFIDLTWDTLDLHRGWFRSLLGLSRTHTRCLYKNENYRECCMRKKEKETSTKPLGNDICSRTKQRTIEYLSGCMWCTSAEKGNRTHAILSCQHTNLQTYRQNMRNLINSKLSSLFNSLQQYTSMDYAHQFLRNIENQFLQHQQLQTGRLKHKPTYRNNTYIDINNLLHKWDQPSLDEAMKNNQCFLISEIFGLQPTIPLLDKGDEELGITDATWLGIIPSFLNDTIIHDFQHISQFCTHTPTKKSITNELITLWEEIKTLIMSKAIGLHRIIGTTGSDFEADLAKNFGDHQTNTSLIPLVASTSNNISSSFRYPNQKRKRQEKRSALISAENDKRIKTESTDTILKQNKVISEKRCEGLTCNKESMFWCSGCNFLPNHIRHTIKQCHRCGTYMTALKRNESILHAMKKQFLNPIKLEQIITFCKKFPDSLRNQYHPLMNLLHEFLPPELHYNKALFTNRSPKRRISERLKLTCRIFHKSIIYSSRKFSDYENITLFALSVTSSSIQRKTNRFQRTKKFNEAVKNKAINSVTDTSFQPQSREAIEANGNSWLSGLAIMKSSEILRTWNVPDTYFGNADGYDILSQWSPQQNWNNFSRIFGSIGILDNKPHGNYFIPLFSGNVTAGHWHLVIVEKRRNKCIGWLLDSLNNSSINSNIHRNIAMIFCPGRHRFTWKTQECRSQTELECGIRVIKSSMMIAKHIQNGNNLETGIQKASLLHIAIDTYEPRILRRSVSTFIDTHTPSMTSTLPRHRRLQLNRESVNSRRNKRRKIQHKTRAECKEGNQIICLSD